MRGRVMIVSRAALVLGGAALVGILVVPAPAWRPNIVVITIDALRADHLGVYGYPRPTSPSIDAFAREAVVVTDAISQAPYTKASIASMLSGLFPTAHKAFTTTVAFSTAMRGSAGSGTVPFTDVLSNDIRTLPETLKAGGYRTIGLTTNPTLLADFGFAQGFDLFRFIADEGQFASAKYVLAQAIELLQAQGDAPVFLWVHLIEPHSPYAPSEPYRSLFPPERPARLIEDAAIPSWIQIDGSRDLNLYLARYDGEIREADAAVGEFLDALRRRDDWEETAVVITADHGEEFFDHGGFEHNTTLYDELLRVPLLVKIPGVSPRRLDAQVQLVDLYPTLARMAGVVPPAGLHGADITPILQHSADDEQYAFAEIVGSRFALRTTRWKYISSLDGEILLFDLRADPRERRNVRAAHPEEVVRLERILARMVGMAVTSGKKIQGQFAPIGPAVLNRLRALGYVTN